MYWLYPGALFIVVFLALYLLSIILKQQVFMTQAVFAEGGSSELRIRNSIWCRILLLVFDKASLSAVSGCCLIAERYDKPPYSNTLSRSASHHHTCSHYFLPFLCQWIMKFCWVEILRCFVFQAVGSVCIWRSSTMYSNNTRRYTLRF